MIEHLNKFKLCSFNTRVETIETQYGKRVSPDGPLINKLGRYNKLFLTHLVQISGV